MKKPRKSKTIGVNAGITLSLYQLTPLIPKLDNWITAHPKQAIAGVCLTNIVLRFFTDTKLVLGPGALLLCLFLMGCTDRGLKPNSTTYYDRNIQFEIKKIGPISGSGVLPVLPSYEIKIHTVGDMDSLFIASCQRFKHFEPGKDEFTYVYTPKNSIESDTVCPLVFKGVEKGKNRLALGYLDFETEKYTLPGFLDCDDKPYVRENGTSVCESLAGLKQSITFEVPVKFDINSGSCATYTNDKGNIFEYFHYHTDDKGVQNDKVIDFELPRGPCTIIIKGKGQEVYHRLETYGFDEVLPVKF